MRGALSRPPGSGCPARSPWAERGPAGVLFFSVYFLCAPFSFLLSLTGWWPSPSGDSDVQRVYSLSMSQTELLGEKPSVDAGPRRDSNLSPGFVREHAWAPGHGPCGTAAPSYHSDSLSPLKHLFFWQLPDAKYGTEDSFLISLGLVTFTCHH